MDDDEVVFNLMVLFMVLLFIGLPLCAAVQRSAPERQTQEPLPAERMPL